MAAYFFTSHILNTSHLTTQPSKYGPFTFVDIYFILWVVIVVCHLFASNCLSFCSTLGSIWGHQLAEYYSPSIIFIYRQIKEAYRKNQWFLLTLRSVPWDSMTLLFWIPCFLLWNFRHFTIIPSTPVCFWNTSVSRLNSRHFLSPQILLALLLISWKSNSIFSLLISVKCHHCKKRINHCAGSLNSHLSSMEQLRWGRWQNGPLSPNSANALL